MERLQAVSVVLCLMCMSAARTHHAPFVSSKAPREIIHNYEIVKPSIVQHGSSGDELVVYIQSDSVSYTLHLVLNVGLLSSKFASTFHTEDGVQQVQKGHTNCFYHGTVVEQPSWRVSMSTCQGLRGSLGPLTDPSQHYHIEPLHPTLKSAQVLDQLHVLYLGSEYSEQGGSCGTKSHSDGMLKPHYISREHQMLRRQLPFAVVEWTLVNDNAQFLLYSGNLTAVVLRSLEIANGVDLIYKEEAVRLAVVDVVTWTMSDPIQIVEDPDVLLDNFQEYSPNLPQNYDSAMLFTGISFAGSTIGIAFTGTMCSSSHSVGLVEDRGRDLNHVISTTAHELGHIFGMNHDTSDCECNDPSQSCIMSATLDFPPPNTWSSCSVETLQTALGGSLSRCLENEPLMTVTDPSCGNGIQEEGEKCDCGTLEECIDPCCNATTCQLVLGAECRAGQCCQPDCQFKPYGTTCRNASTECDIAEYCTGDQADCPRNVYLQDLTFCRGNDSYCYSGQCNTRDSQCMEHFQTVSAIDECYTDVNTRGFVDGHCGHNDTHYIPCEEKDAFCGQIQCVPGTLQTATGFRTTETIFVGGERYTCRSVTTRAGSDQVSPGLIRDGTPCGDEMICLSSKCVSTSVVDVRPCPNGRNGEVCSGQGLCNNENKCSCFVDFEGAACDGLQSGGDNAGTIAGAVIGVLLFLAIIVGVVIAVGYLVWRSKSAKYIARRYIPRTIVKGTAQGNVNSFTHVHVKGGSSTVTSQPQSRTQLQPPKRSAPLSPTQPSSNGRPSPPASRPPPPTRPAPPPTRPPTRPPPPSSNKPPATNRPPPPSNKPPTTTRPPPPASKPLPVSMAPPTNRPPPPAPVRTPPSLAKKPPSPPQAKPAPRPAPRAKPGTRWPPPSD